jgi:hypothetical protein
MCTQAVSPILAPQPNNPVKHPQCTKLPDKAKAIWDQGNQTATSGDHPDKDATMTNPTRLLIDPADVMGNN